MIELSPFRHGNRLHNIGLPSLDLYLNLSIQCPRQPAWCNFEVDTALSTVGMK